ncbi:MAG: hypothetical protein ACLUQ6_08620 [Alistipes onderdonkii]
MKSDGTVAVGEELRYDSRKASTHCTGSVTTLSSQITVRRCSDTEPL